MFGGSIVLNGDNAFTYFFASINGGPYDYINIDLPGTTYIASYRVPGGVGYFPHNAVFTYVPDSSVETISLKVYYQVTAGGYWNQVGSPPIIVRATEIKV